MENKSLLWGTLIAAFIAALFSLVAIVNVQDIPTAAEIASQVQLPVNEFDEDAIATSLAEKLGTELPEDIQSQLDDINQKLYEEDNYKSFLKKVAYDEIFNDDDEPQRSFLKDLYSELKDQGYDIDSRSDIEYVKVRDVDVNSFDIDDEEGVVEYKLKTRFYDETEEDDLKETFYVTFTIEEGDVEEIEFEF